MAIDVGELKPCSFEKAQPADIDGGQTRPVDGQPDAVEEDPDFLTAENDGEFRFTRRSDEVEQLPLSTDGVREEELDPAQRDREARARKMFDVREVEEVFPQLLLAEAIGGCVKMVGEGSNGVHVGFLRAGREPAKLHVLDHPLA